MNRVSLRLAFVVVTLVLLHYTLRPLLQWGASPDFMLIAAMLISLRVRPGVAALFGFAVGLIVDAQNPASLGSSALGLACVSFAASFLKGTFFADKPAMNAALFFLGKWAFDIVFIITEGRIAGSDTLMQILVWSPIAAAVTALMGSITMMYLQPMMREARR